MNPEGMERLKKLVTSKLSAVPGFPFTGMSASLRVSPGGGGGGIGFEDGIDPLAFLGIYTEAQYSNASWKEDYAGADEEKIELLTGEMLNLDIQIAVQDAVSEFLSGAQYHLDIRIRAGVLSLAGFSGGSVRGPDIDTAAFAFSVTLSDAASDQPEEDDEILVRIASGQVRAATFHQRMAARFPDYGQPPKPDDTSHSQSTVTSTYMGLPGITGLGQTAARCCRLREAGTGEVPMYPIYTGE